MTSPHPRPGLQHVAPYVPGAREIEGTADPIKLSANESPLGPSPRAIAAYHALAPTLFRYPDASQRGLRAAIGQVYEVEPERVICGNGSDEVLSFLIRAYAGVGDEVILSQYSFGMCFTHTHVQGAKVVVAPEPDCRISVSEILSRVSPQTKMVILASPNNPCGTYLPMRELRQLHAALPASVLLVLDAAYAEYVSSSDYDSGITLARTADNVVVTHTFSKLYGLAGLRIGWGYGPARVIDNLQRIRTPFNTNAAALAAAEAAVLDRDHARMVREHTDRWRSRLIRECSALGLEVIPSATNFILILLQSGARDAVAAVAHLKKRNIIPRPLGAGGPDNALRITIGLDSDNEAVIAALREFMS
ncbi:MAG TPA: histidinol-phosphate transaminase [Steroidobacteraceae bacterium]|nr:histidinol-phosphate transaminase [Steroidobacteraceae bacterium]